MHIAKDLFGEQVCDQGRIANAESCCAGLLEQSGTVIWNPVRALPAWCVPAAE